MYTHVNSSFTIWKVGFKGQYYIGMFSWWHFGDRYFTTLYIYFTTSSLFLQEPFYKGELITFDVVPEKLPFQVAHSSLKLSTNFQVAGFSVSGQVLDSVKVKQKFTLAVLRWPLRDSMNVQEDPVLNRSLVMPQKTFSHI